jgi:hypothetical protein
MELITVEKEEVKQGLDAYARFIPSSKAANQDGRVTVVDQGAEYYYNLKLFERLPVELGLAQRYIGIKNSTVVKMPAHLTGLITGAEFTLPFFKLEKTYFRAAFYPSFYSDDWNFHSSSFRIPVQTFLIYQPSEQWTFVGGVAVYPSYQNRVLPILGFIYQPNDRLVFNIIPDRPNITYSLTKKIDLSVEGSISDEEFEVTKDDLRNVILHYREGHAAGAIKYKFNKFIECSLAVGGIFQRSLKYDDSNLGKVRIRESAYTEFRVVIKM